MPTPLSCKSASALDSLPRSANARRSGTALHRLQQQRSKQSQTDDFGSWDESGSALQFFPSPSSQPFPTTSNRPRRRISDRMAPRRRRNSSKRSQGVASTDLPLASSDLDARLGSSSSATSVFGSPTYPSRDAFSDGEQDNLGGISEDEDDEERSIRVVGGGPPRTRALSLSPRKLYQPIMMPSPQDESRSQTPTPIAPPSPSKRQAMPARKRVITKDMIGNPTNFQHTGHIGASSYGAMQADGDSDKLRQQLSEVAAALRLDDDDVQSSCVTGSREASKDSEVTLADQSSAVPTVETSKSSALSEVQADELAAVIQSPAPLTADHPVHTVSESSNSRPTSPAPSSQSGGLKRTTSKRKPVPAPRNLADLYGEFSEPNGSPMDEQPKAILHAPTSVPARIEEEPDLVQEHAHVANEPRPVPTIRANGKRFVQGPAGEYITETANVRWNKALNEITLALKDDSAQDGDDDDEDVDIQRGLDRADDVLRRLNAM